MISKDNRQILTSRLTDCL